MYEYCECWCGCGAWLIGPEREFGVCMDCDEDWHLGDKENSFDEFELGGEG